MAEAAGPTGRRSLAASADRRGEVLRTLKRAQAPLSVVEIARRLDVHPNTVRFHLDTLLENGQVEHVAPEIHRPGRPPVLFRAVRAMDPTGPRDYRVLAEILTRALVSAVHDDAPTVRAMEAGRAWGRQLEPPTPDADDLGGADVGELLSLLDHLGFAPELRADDPAQVELRSCPFLELAEAAAGVVCPIHLGIMQGALEAWDSDITVDRLEPFVEPDLCVAHLAAVGAAR
jgi:predicted ArsR family transcriptional regulator